MGLRADGSAQRGGQAFGPARIRRLRVRLRPSRGPVARCRNSAAPRGRICRVPFAASSRARATAGSDSSGGFERTFTFTIFCGKIFRSATSDSSGPAIETSDAIFTAVSMPSPVVASSRNRMCPDCSPPKFAPDALHFLQHVAVAHVCARQLQPRFFERALQPQVRHGGADDGRPFSAPDDFKIAPDRQQHAVAIHQPARCAWRKPRDRRRHRKPRPARRRFATTSCCIFSG